MQLDLNTFLSKSSFNKMTNLRISAFIQQHYQYNEPLLRRPKIKIGS